jgi:hypothetical protein
MIQITGTDAKKYYILLARGSGKTMLSLEIMKALIEGGCEIESVPDELERLKDGLDKFEIEVKEENT